jgi:SAM-dependent methyltransferase
MRPIDLTRGVRNALILIGKCNWREFLVRLRISLGQIDLKDDASEAVSERTYYYADSGGLAFDKIMGHFKIMPDDAIVDFGCGKGGILISLSKYPFSKIAGVEIAIELVEIARGNIRKLKIRNVEIACCDAVEFDRLNEFNYFYFFDPFPGVVMQDVIRNIERSIAEKPRKVTIIYLNPSCHDLFDTSSVLHKTAELPHFEHRCYVYSNEG